MKKNLLLLTAGFLYLTNVQAQTTATGYVYNDANSNGKKDRREVGIPGVSVSNGVQVVLTDGKGRYELPVGDDNILFVIKPAGYKVPLNDLNQPQFYYIHKPKGSPELKYKGTAPTGPLPKSVDFALIAQPEPAQFTALVFGDPQPYNLREMSYFANGVVKELEGVKDVAFGITMGDLVGDNLSLHQPYKETIAKIGLPWYNVIGNHDENYDVTADSLSDETFEANFGPANYAFNYGNAHFIVLDDIIYPDPRDGQGYVGGFRKDQLDFVENDLKLVDKSKLIVLAFHIPALNAGGGSFRMEDRQRLFDLLSEFPNTFSMSAHTHIQRQSFYQAADGFRRAKPHHEYNVGTTCGDWWSGPIDEKGMPPSTMRDGTPNGYAFLRINGNQYDVDYKVAGKPVDYQISIYHPKVLAAGAKARPNIFANFFMGDKDTKVEYRIDEQEWAPMEYTEGHDPSYEGALYQWDGSETLMRGGRPSSPVNSTHLWRAAIVTKLPAGDHQIEVRATDMFGKTHQGKSSYRLEELKR